MFEKLETLLPSLFVDATAIARGLQAGLLSASVNPSFPAAMTVRTPASVGSPALGVRSCAIAGASGSVGHGASSTSPPRLMLADAIRRAPNASR